jgi:uroporphyrinogen decarboxylase
MLEACRTPDLVAELTMQPVRRHHVDAAVLFSDIVVPLAAVGVDVDIKPGVGPVMGTPVRTAADVAAIRPLDAADVDYRRGGSRLWPNWTY